jgi:hypothetical protein
MDQTGFVDEKGVPVFGESDKTPLALLGGEDVSVAAQKDKEAAKNDLEMPL